MHAVVACLSVVIPIVYMIRIDVCNSDAKIMQSCKMGYCGGSISGVIYKFNVLTRC